MKAATITTLAFAGLLPIAAFAQTPPTPPTPPVPPVPAVPPVPPHGGDRDRGERLPKVPVTYLGVETSSVPRVVSEQLGLQKGFGLVVDYVVPDGPAAAAGVQPNDILKNLNEQILMEPDQLSKLIRSFPEGTTVTLTVLRKGAETKLTAKLSKREVAQRRGWDRHGRHGEGFGAIDLTDLDEDLDKMRDGVGNMKFSFNTDETTAEIREQVREQAREAREAARAAARQGAEAGREAARQAREALRAAREMRITQRDHGAVKTTRIDMGKAQIVYHDAQGELKIESVAGKKVLTAKDPQGRLVFSGPIKTKEELDKMPAEVRQRFDKLEQKDLPNVVPPSVVSREQENDADDDAADVDAEDDSDSDNSDDDDAEATEAVPQVSFGDDVKSVPYRRFGINTVTINPPSDVEVLVSST